MSNQLKVDVAAAVARMLKTLDQKVDPSLAALLVVDVQNDFCATGGAAGREGRDLSAVQAMVPRLSGFVAKAREARLPILFIQTIANAPNNWFLSDVWLEQSSRRGKRYTEYPALESGSWGADFYEIKPLPGDVIVNKYRYSAFIDTNLDLILRSKGIRTLIVTGVATNVCVESTARDGFMKDYYIVIPEDCVAATYSQELHRTALQNLDIYFGKVVPSAEIAQCWKPE